jgi:hypothetical protein
MIFMLIESHYLWLILHVIKIFNLIWRLLVTGRSQRHHDGRMLLIIRRLVTLNTAVVELFEINLEVTFDLLELFAVLCDMPLLVTYVAPYKKNLVVFFII